MGSEDVERVAEAALGLAREGETVAGIVAGGAAAGTRVYLCAYANVDDERSWLVLDADGIPVTDRSLVRDVVSIAALCELAEDVAFSGDLEELRTRLDELEATDAPSGIDEARGSEDARGRARRAAAGCVRRAARRAWRSRTETRGSALDPAGGSPFSTAMRGSSTGLAELLPRWRAPTALHWKRNRREAIRPRRS